VTQTPDRGGMHRNRPFGYDDKESVQGREPMADNSGDDARMELLNLLLDKVEADKYPSSTMLDIIEKLLTPETAPAYADVLMAKIRDENYPSLALIRRVVDFA